MKISHVRGYVRKREKYVYIQEIYQKPPGRCQEVWLWESVQVIRRKSWTVLSDSSRTFKSVSLSVRMVNSLVYGMNQYTTRIVNVSPLMEYVKCVVPSLSVHVPVLSLRNSMITSFLDGSFGCHLPTIFSSCDRGCSQPTADPHRKEKHTNTIPDVTRRFMRLLLSLFYPTAVQKSTRMQCTIDVVSTTRKTHNGQLVVLGK